MLSMVACLGGEKSFQVMTQPYRTCFFRSTKIKNIFWKTSSVYLNFPFQGKKKLLGSVVVWAYMPEVILKKRSQMRRQRSLFFFGILLTTTFHSQSSFAQGIITQDPQGFIQKNARTFANKPEHN